MLHQPYTSWINFLVVTESGGLRTGQRKRKGWDQKHSKYQ